MRMIGEIAYGKEEGEKEQIRNNGEVEEQKMVALGGQRKYTPVALPALKLVVVGYALTSKKIKSFLQPKLEGLARNKGIQFVAIDQSRPLSDQGPFDIVLHKLSGKEWRHVLEIKLAPEAMCPVTYNGQDHHASSSEAVKIKGFSYDTVPNHSEEIYLADIL